MRFTSGEWKVSETDSEGHYVIESNNGRTCICYGAGFYGDVDESLANAALICAAPKLLDAVSESVAELLRLANDQAQLTDEHLEDIARVDLTVIEKLQRLLVPLQ